VLKGDAPRIHYIHTNEIGTPTAVTNQNRQVVWRTTHTAFGEAQPIASPDGKARFTLELRLPGQYHDAETGWHDNVLRTYDPRRGQYLEPDPLGPHPLTRPYAYAANNPLMYADPLGLILFAFDGTNNNESSRTNIYWLQEAYDDNDPHGIARAARPYYETGPGTDDWAFGDSAVAYTLKPKVVQQLDRLDSYVVAKFKDETEVRRTTVNPERPLLITLDIIGFSRGAAGARDFANEVLTRRNAGHYRDLVGGGCVGIVLRFMGLFDTVLSAQINGRVNLSIPYSQIGTIAHAVALNEHRALFPLESAESSYADRGFGANVIERGFIGAHADIGGGYVVEDGGDLSDVALNWMHQQAETAGVPMIPLREAQRIVTHPVVHDESPMFPWVLPAFGGLSDDREVRYPDSVLHQRSAEIEGMTHAESRDYIVPPTVEPITPNPYVDGVETPPPRTNRAGTVDMDAYRAWLRSNYSLSIN
jgi:RHS repeat-associated protein